MLEISCLLIVFLISCSGAGSYERQTRRSAALVGSLVDDSGSCCTAVRGHWCCRGRRHPGSQRGRGSGSEGQGGGRYGGLPGRWLQRETQDQLVAHVTVSPLRGASNVALNAPVSVTSGFGAISAVVVRDKAGDLLTGTLNAGHTQWLADEALAPTAHYFVTATVTSSGGVSAEVNTDFTTLTPAAPVTATAYPTTGAVVGVGQPIVIDFDQDINSAAEQQAVLAHFTVTESKPVPGGWHWFSPTELHFRPETFWPAGERVTISGSLDGLVCR